MAAFDTSELLDVIRLRGMLPSNSPDWTVTRILAQATREMYATHLPMLVAARGEYLVKTTDIPCVAGQASYRLNRRCAAVRHVALLRADGTLQPLEELKPGEASNMRLDTARRGQPAYYSFNEHSLSLWPLPESSSDKIRVKWHIRPNKLIASDTTVAVITLIALDTPTAGITELNFTAVPTAPAPGTFDFIKPSHPFDIMGFDLTKVSVTATQLRFTATDIPQDLVAGDYVHAAGTSIFPNIPQELHEPLALRTAAAIVKSKRDGLAKDLEDEALAKERQLLVGILAPRSKGNHKRLVSRRWG